MRTELQSFYSPLKDLDPYLRFVFITGISKFSQLSIFSQLNNLVNISMSPHYATICGITGQELRGNFTEGIHQLSQTYKTTEEKIFAEMKRRYDGYHSQKTVKVSTIHSVCYMPSRWTKSTTTGLAPAHLPS